MASNRRAPLPSVSAYLIREFLGMFVPIVLGFVILYLIVDVFDRLDVLLRNHATIPAAIRYFAFKIPLMFTQIMPPAALAGTLLSLGMVSRRNEIVALRASGISLGQMAMPLLGLGLLISCGTLAWNETVVPYCTREYQYVNNIEIRKRPLRGILSDHEIWYHGADGFYNIEHIDPKRSTLFGLTIYRTDASFDLHEIIEVPSAQWTGDRWITSGAIDRSVAADGEIRTTPVPADVALIHETLNDFLEVHREPEELSYGALRQHIRQLRKKGIDPSSYLVDLHLKLAVPFATFVLACVAVPLGGRVQRHPSIAAILGTGLAIGFGYWVVLALTNALGQSGVLPAVVAAWAANFIFMLIAAALFLSTE